MADQRLPIVNQDDGTWGDILRQYLMKEHVNDDTNNPLNGSHKNITIIAGTTSAAPLKFTSGSLLTTAQPGAMEFNDDSFYLTQTTGAVRKKIAAYNPTGSTGDLYYRDSGGNFTRLGVGTSSQVLTVNSGLPSWQAPSVPAGFMVDEDNMASNSDTRVPTQQSVKAYVDTGLASKVSTTTNGSRLYGTDGSGNQIAHNFNIEAFGWTVPMRKASGEIEVGTPTDPEDATSKSYVDTALSGKENAITAGTTGQYWRGDKSWQALNKASVGLSNVDNTSDATKNSAAATLTNKIVNAPDNTLTNIAVSNFAASAIVTESEGISSNDNDTTLPTSAAIKDYVDARGPKVLSGTSSTAAATVAKVATVGDGTHVPTAGDWFVITFTSGSTSSNPTLNINGSGARPVATPANDTTNWSIWVTSGMSLLLWYDGTRYLTFPTANDYPDEIAESDIAATTSSDAFLMSGRRIEYMAVRESSVARTLTNKRIIPRVLSVASSSSYTMNTDLRDGYSFTALAANITFVNPTGAPSDQQKLMVRIKDNGTARTVGWGSDFQASGVATMVVQTIPNREHTMQFVYSTGVNKWVCLAADAVGY